MVEVFSADGSVGVYRYMPDGTFTYVISLDDALKKMTSELKHKRYAFRQIASRIRQDFSCEMKMAGEKGERKEARATKGTANRRR